MTRVRLGAVSYLNTRPLVRGLEQSARFDLRFDLPSRCADLLHQGAIDVGLIPSIEYLRGPAGASYSIVPDISLASRGPVASVALYTRTPIDEVRSVAMDTASRTSVALLRVLCARLFKIAPEATPYQPDPRAMLASCDAALIIGDNALFLDHVACGLNKIDLGAAWLELTGLPFVYAFWAGRPGTITGEDVSALQRSRDAGVVQAAEVAAEAYPDEPRRRQVAERYLRDNMKYDLGDDARAGLELFYRYAAEAGCVQRAGTLRFFR
jgi:chorismate dehydratase